MWSIRCGERTSGSTSATSELDIVIDEALGGNGRDQEEVDLAVELGVFTSADATEIRRRGEQVVAMIEHGDAWWTGGHDWAPNPSRLIPALPDGWDVL